MNQNGIKNEKYNHGLKKAYMKKPQNTIIEEINSRFLFCKDKKSDITK